MQEYWRSFQIFPLIFGGTMCILPRYNILTDNRWVELYTLVVKLERHLVFTLQELELRVLLVPKAILLVVCIQTNHLKTLLARIFDT